MATDFQDPNGRSNLQILAPQKAHQACLICRKQKRKCDKGLPRCGLCARMARQCDYSDPPPVLSPDEVYILQLKVQDLEARLNASTIHDPQFLNEPSNTKPFTSQANDENHHNSVPNRAVEEVWITVKNRFPSIAFLDCDAYRMGGVKIPIPKIEIPAVVLQLLEDTDIQDVVNQYAVTIHRWMPVILLHKLDQVFKQSIWELEPDCAVILLAMKLILVRPLDGVEINQNSLYGVTKRFLGLLECAGFTSLLMLQANTLVAWYEYGHAIYPAAYLTIGWCTRYGNLLGISDNAESIQLLPLETATSEREERRRTWWSVLIVDRLVSMGSHGRMLNNQIVLEIPCLPVDDELLDQVESRQDISRHALTLVSKKVGPFPQLCQSSVMAAKVLSQHYALPIDNEDERFQLASQLYIEISILANTLTAGSDSIDFLSSSSALAVTFSAVSMLCKRYSSVTKDGDTAETSMTEAATTMRSQAIDGIRTVSLSIVEFSQKIHEAIAVSHNLARVSPIIMDALYAAATNYAWLVRENKDEESQQALESLRQCLHKLGERWRSATEYLRILEAQEFTHMVGGR